MSNRADEVRKRIAKRKRQHQFQNPKINVSPNSVIPKDEEKYGQSPLPIYDDGQNNEIHPLFRKDVFIFKILLSACLVLVVAIIFKNQSAQFETSRNLVQKTLSNEFQFTAFTTWYEDKFGKPLALFPLKDKKEKNSNNENYVIPANGKVLENFTSNGQGIMIETANHESVDAVKEGTVIYAGKKDKLGKTVIIQHGDGTQTWYGDLQSISVNIYDFVEKGKVIGKVMDVEDKTKGQYYFAIKKGDHFIDPSQVISFD